MGRFKFSETNNSWDEDNNDALSLSSLSSSSPPAAFEFTSDSDSSSSESVTKDDIKDHKDEIKKDASYYDSVTRNVLDALQAKEDAVKAKMAGKDETIAELSAKYAELVDKTQKMNEEMSKKTVNEMVAQMESVRKEGEFPPAGYYYLKAAPELGATNAESKTPFYYRSFYDDDRSWTVIKEAEAIGLGPFPASGLFKLLYHPNGTSVVLASLSLVVVAQEEEATTMLSLEGWLKKDADVKFVPKKAYFRISQQRQGSNIFVLQSEINPSACMEVIFEPREMHTHRFTSLPFGAECRIRHGSYSMGVVSDMAFTHNLQSRIVTYFPCDFVRVLFNQSGPAAVFKLIRNDDETVSLQVLSSELVNGTKTWTGLTNEIIPPAPLINYSCKDFVLVVEKVKRANVFNDKFELLFDKSNGSVRLFPLGTDHFVGLFGPHKKYWKPADATELFLEEVEEITEV